MNIYPFLRTKQQKAYNFRRLLFSFCSIIFLRINKYVVKKTQNAPADDCGKRFFDFSPIFFKCVFWHYNAIFSVVFLTFFTQQMWKTLLQVNKDGRFSYIFFMLSEYSTKNEYIFAFLYFAIS